MQRVVLHYHNLIEEADLPPLRMTLDAFQYELILVALCYHQGVAAKAARFLNINRTTLVEKQKTLASNDAVQGWLMENGFLRRSGRKMGMLVYNSRYVYHLDELAHRDAIRRTYCPHQDRMPV